MSSDYKSSKFKELLEKLQQESWQLELLISGFAIFGLFTAYPHILSKLQVAESERQIYTFAISLIAFIACSILIFNLMVHVVIRGLWIGALGLRYVSGDIDFDELNYHKNFKNFLKRKIVSFDKYVANLENYCSVLFAVSFLLIFYVISIAILFLLFILIATQIISNEALPENLRTVVGIVLLLFLVFGAFLMIVDFITQGFLKKKKWLAKIYYPFYRVLSFVSLSFLYRPLVYNFLDNKFTKRLSFFLLPAYACILFFISFTYQNSNYLKVTKQNPTLYLEKSKYDDMLTEKEDLVNRASIQSKVITEPYIKFFYVFRENIEGRMYGYKKSLKPKEDKRGFKSEIFLNTQNNRSNNSASREYMGVFNEMYSVQIDTTYFDSEFLLSKNTHGQIGFETHISTKNLSEGKHLLQLKRKYIRKSDTINVTDVVIPFWYFKE